MPPSRFAGEPRDFRLAAPNGVHFHPPGGLLLPGHPRTTTMDLSDRLIEHDHWHTTRLLRAGRDSVQRGRWIARSGPGRSCMNSKGPNPT